MAFVHTPRERKTKLAYRETDFKPMFTHLLVEQPTRSVVRAPICLTSPPLHRRPSNLPHNATGNDFHGSLRDGRGCILLHPGSRVSAFFFSLDFSPAAPPLPWIFIYPTERESLFIEILKIGASKLYKIGEIFVFIGEAVLNPII